MQGRFERLLARLTASNPMALSTWVRLLLVHYFFHVSDRNCVELVGEGEQKLNLLTPTQFKGLGRILVSNTAHFGVLRSPGSLTAAYVEARTPESLIEIGPGTVFNNGCVMVAEGASIRFGANCLIGPQFQALDANGHDLALDRRHQPDPRPAAIEVGDEVFIGSRVTLLKGVKLGRGCVVAAGSVLMPHFEAPPMSIIAGNPAVITGQLAAAGQAAQ